MERLAERTREQAQGEELSEQVEMMKAMLKRREQEAQRLRGEESELVGLVGAAQAHLADIDARLDELERSMNRQ